MKYRLPTFCSLCLAAAAWCVFVSCADSLRAEDRPPNIVYILADDMHHLLDVDAAKWLTSSVNSRISTKCRILGDPTELVSIQAI